MTITYTPEKGGGQPTDRYIEIVKIVIFFKSYSNYFNDKLTIAA